MYPLHLGMLGRNPPDVRILLLGGAKANIHKYRVILGHGWYLLFLWIGGQVAWRAADVRHPPPFGTDALGRCCWFINRCSTSFALVERSEVVPDLFDRLPIGFVKFTNGGRCDVGAGLWFNCVQSAPACWGLFILFRKVAPPVRATSGVRWICRTHEQKM